MQEQTRMLGNYPLHSLQPNKIWQKYNGIGKYRVLSKAFLRGTHPCRYQSTSDGLNDLLKQFHIHFVCFVAGMKKLKWLPKKLECSKNGVMIATFCHVWELASKYVYNQPEEIFLRSENILVILVAQSFWTLIKRHSWKSFYRNCVGSPRLSTFKAASIC